MAARSMTRRRQTTFAVFTVLLMFTTLGAYLWSGLTPPTSHFLEEDFWPFADSPPEKNHVEATSLRPAPALPSPLSMTVETTTLPLPAPPESTVVLNDQPPPLNEQPPLPPEPEAEPIKWLGEGLIGPGPEYKSHTIAEMSLPQHNLDLPFPEGRTGRYIKFSNQINTMGWNNVISEWLLLSHVAWRSNRAYVFSDFYWGPDMYPWRHLGGVRSPLSTLISGPTVGGPWEKGDTAPRAIRDDWWPHVCPENEVERIWSDTIKNVVEKADGIDVMEYWVKVLSENPSRCVEILPSPPKPDEYPQPQAFDFRILATHRALSMWPQIKASPVSRLLDVSPLIKEGLLANEHLFYPPHIQPPFGYDPYAHMLALHIRRGDFAGHCTTIAHHNLTFWQWNGLPELLDPFIQPVEFELGNAPQEVLDAYWKRCMPSNEYILDKIIQSRAEWENNGPGRRIDILYLLTNSQPDWIAELNRLLMERQAGWHIVMSKSMNYTFEQIGVGLAIDMEVARKAALFIGNGWSSFTGSIVHRRLVDEREPLSTRFM